MIYFVSCVSVNIICTFGIIVRLWRAAWSNRRILRSNADIYLQSLVIIMESGVLFTTISLVLLVSMAIQSVASLAVFQGFVNIGVQTAVIAPLLILVRTEFGISHGLGPVWRAHGSRPEGSTTMEMHSYNREDRNGAIPINIAEETVATSDNKGHLGEHDPIGVIFSGVKERRHSDVESGRSA